MKPYLLIILLLGSSTMLLGQENEKNISWSIETSLEYQLEQDQQQFIDKGPEYRSIPIKADLQRNIVGPKNYLTNLVLDLLSKGELKGYPEPGAEAIPAEKMNGLLKNLKAYEIETFELKQRWRFDATEKVLSSEIIGVYPIYSIEGTRDRLCWIPFDANNSKSLFDINNPDLTWISMVTSMLNLDQATEIKGATSSFKAAIFDALEKADYYPYEGSEANPLAWEQPKDRAFLTCQIVGCIDSIITFNPDTYEEKIKVIHNLPMDPGNIKKLQVHQFIYFDQSTKALRSLVYAMKPYLYDPGTGDELRGYPLCGIRFDVLPQVNRSPRKE
ncbi:MAG: hypothetical protein AAF598_09250 [Bacteroidota bacterium]